MSALVYQIPLGRLEAFRGRALVVRTDRPSDLVAAVRPNELRNLAYVQLNGQPTAACWSCGATGETESRPPRLMLDLNDRLVVMLHVGKELFGHHLAGRSFDYRIPLARAEHDPQVGWPLVLRNLGTDAWVADYADGEHVTVPPRRAIRIEAGTRIRFGSVTGVVEA